MPQITFYRHPVKITIEPNIGLDSNARQSVIDLLSVILADETILIDKTNQINGETHGANATQLQTLYDLQCKQIDTIANEVAERIQILGGVSQLGLDISNDSSRLGKDINLASYTMGILGDHEAFIRFLREDARKCSEIFDDQGTYEMLIRILCIHEKIAWVLRRKIASE